MRRKGEIVGLNAISLLLTANLIFGPVVGSTGPGIEPLESGDGPSPLAANDWTNMNPTGPPAARFGHSMVYASWPDKVVLFGGRTSLGQNDHTWVYSYNTNTWTYKFSSFSPSPRYRHAMAYDSQSNRVVVFGGYLSNFLSDTWAYDPTGDWWSDKSPASRPSARMDAAMAYDAESDRIVLFGGYGAAGELNDTWTYDFNSNTWTNMNTGGLPRRYAHAMTYDTESDRVVMFGGWVAGGSGYSDQTWTYDYNTNTWVNKNPSTKPAARSDCPLVYSSRSDRVYMFGGLGFTRFSDTWAYNLNANSWTNVNPPSKPSAREEHDMAYDSESGIIVLFAGEDASNSFSDTWAFEVPTGLPSAPRSPLAVAGNNTVNLTWLPPSDTGGSPVTNYTVHRGIVSGGESILVTIGNVLAYNDTGLTNGQKYYYRIAARNAVGAGPNSTEVNATPAAPPGAPTNLAAVPGDTQITLTWLAPAYDGGTPIVNYTVYRGTASGGESFLFKLGNVLTHVDMGLTNGQIYYYQVGASNAYIEGPRSNEASATPSPPTAPGAPRNLVASGGNMTVSLTWLPPLSDGGSPITKYSLYRGTAPGGLAFLIDVTALGHTDGGLTNGVTYYYRVSASNAIGEGPQSGEASATPTEFVDIEPPTVSISSPADGAILTTATVTVTGTASDNVGVMKVEISTDGSNWVTASGTTSWSGDLTLIAGSTTIYARATDTSGRTATATIVVSLTTGGPEGGQGDATLIIVAGIVLLTVVLATLAMFILRKRKRRGKLDE